MQAFWFGIIAVLWAGFFVLEGFDFGVGVLLPLVARTETDRKVAVRAIGPVWDGNEVWLLVAGGATFAAFPEWYASLFAGFYLAFALLLVGLILRGIGIEYRGKATTDAGRAWCDGAFIAGSFVPALLVGVAFADILRGVNMTARHDVTSTFFSLLTPYALLGGLVTLSLFALHAALYLRLRTEGAVRDRALHPRCAHWCSGCVAHRRVRDLDVTRQPRSPTSSRSSCWSRSGSVSRSPRVVATGERLRGLPLRRC